MKILLDECLPIELKLHLGQFDAATVAEMGWQSLKNGDLLRSAVEKGFEIFLTTDKNLEFQQNIKTYKISIIIFDVFKNKIQLIVPLLPKFISMMDTLEKGKAYRI